DLGQEGGVGGVALGAVLQRDEQQPAVGGRGRRPRPDVPGVQLRLQGLGQPGYLHGVSGGRVVQYRLQVQDQVVQLELDVDGFRLLGGQRRGGGQQGDAGEGQGAGHDGRSSLLVV